MSKFQVGDKVRAFGLDGVVERLYDGNYCVFVRYSNDESESFTSEGYSLAFHKEPSLVLVERPKKKKKVWVNLYADRFNLVEGSMHASITEANDYATDNRFACVEIEVDDV